MPDEKRAVLRRSILSCAAFWIVLFFALFLPAGDLWWTQGWLFFLVFVVLMVLAVAYLWCVNPEIFVARSKIQAGTKNWDLALVSILLLSHMAEFPVAGFDGGRFHSSNVPLWVVVLGYGLLCLGFAVLTWVQKVNRFAEPGVRIHSKQKVIDIGPYATVRHPMYAGAIPYFVGIAFALGSYWTLVPAAMAILVLVLRTAMEDRALQKDLTGYKDYANRVRYRLVPGVW